MPYVSLAGLKHNFKSTDLST